VRGVCELGFERCEPGVVERAVTALNLLPCTSVGGPFLDGEVDPANGDIVFLFIVENGLEG